MDARVLAGNLGTWSAGKGSLQQKLAYALTHVIRQGLLNPGIRLPSERSLAASLALSRTTVVAAYDALRESGWLESRKGSGTWVAESSPALAAARGAAQAGTLAQSRLLGMLTHRPEADMLNFAMGTPQPLRDMPVDAFTLPPDEQAALVRDHHYYPLGLPALRQALAVYYAELSLPTTPEQILVTNGGQQAIALCANFYLQRGDAGLVEDPVYFGAIEAFRATGARVFGLPVGPDGVVPNLLRGRITATAARLVYLTPAFQNPTGAVMPRAARKEVARIASDLDVPVIEDETLADLALESTPPPAIATFAPAAPILTIGSLSKLLWPGLRVGWIRASEPVIERLARLKTVNDLASPLVTQAVAVRLLGMVREARRLRREQLKPRRDLLVSLLRARLPEWSFRVPSGGLFLWVKLPRGDSREFAQTALRHGLVVLPGPTMSASEQHAGFLRVPFLAEPETLRTGVGRLAAAWREFQSAGRREQRASVPLV